MHGWRTGRGMESNDAGDDGVIPLDEERHQMKRMQHDGRRPDIRRGINLAGPGTEAGVRDGPPMVVAGGLWFMVERAGNGKDGQDQIDPR